MKRDDINVIKDGIIKIKEKDIRFAKGGTREYFAPERKSKCHFELYNKEIGDFYIRLSHEKILAVDFFSECAQAFIDQEEHMREIIEKAKKRFKEHKKDNIKGMQERETKDLGLTREEKEKIFNFDEKDLPEL